MTSVLARNVFIRHVGERRAGRGAVKGHKEFHVAVNLDCEITLSIMPVWWSKDFYLSVPFLKHFQNPSP